jgi:hypothetical protein
MAYTVEASSTCRRVNHPKYDDFRLVTTTVQFDRRIGIETKRNCGIASRRERRKKEMGMNRNALSNL